MKKFKVSYSYPLEHPIKVVIEHIGLQGLVGWLYQKYGKNVSSADLLISERIIELPMLHQFLGSIFRQPIGKILEIGHVASSAALELASLGFDVSAIDLRPYPFTHPNLKSIEGDFLKHDFNTEFDAIFSLSTIEHFGISKRYGGEDEKENTLDEEAFSKISKLLKSTGKAIISVPYAKVFVSGIWFRVYTRDDIENKLNKVFKIEEARYYRRDKNIWTQVVDKNNDPASPHDGVAIFLLSKK